MPGDRRSRQVLTTAGPGSLDELHDLFAQLWSDRPVPPLDRMAFETAVAEVIGNVVQHASAGEPVRLRVLLHSCSDRLEADVEDAGVPYVPVAATDADELPESGRGLSMAGALADEVRYERDGDVNRWVVVRLLREAGGRG